MAFKPRRCIVCGKGTVNLSAKSGRIIKRGNQTLNIPDWIMIPTCDNCECELIDKETAKLLDRLFYGT